MSPTRYCFWSFPTKERDPGEESFSGQRWLGEKEQAKKNFKLMENTVSFQLPGQMAICHNADNQEFT